MIKHLMWEKERNTEYIMSIGGERRRRPHPGVATSVVVPAWLNKYTRRLVHDFKFWKLDMTCHIIIRY